MMLLTPTPVDQAISSGLASLGMNSAPKKKMVMAE